MTPLVALIVVIVVYFFPAFNARDRRHNNASAILVTNLFLGWTLLGWVAALVWSYTDNVQKGFRK